MDNISITLFRVDTTSNYVDCIMQCPSDYYFTSFQLQAKVIVDNKIVTQWFDLSPALFLNTYTPTPTPAPPYPTTKQKNWTIRIPIAKLGISTPAMYTAVVKAEYLYNSNGYPVPFQNPVGGTALYTKIEDPASSGKWYVAQSGTTTKITDWDGEYVPALPGADGSVVVKETLQDSMVCSDVNFVYRCVLDEVLNQCDPCAGVSDDAIRKYLVLYGHQASLSVNDQETAEEYFKLLHSCFSHCSTSARPNNVPSCNCANR